MRGALRSWVAVVMIVAVAAAVRAAVAERVPLLEAEAYYWVWSRELAWGYHDHPPMIAWVIRAGTSVFGDSPLGIRSGPILLSALGSLAFFSFARRATSPFIATVATAFLQIAPFWFPFGIVAIPDAPLLFFWTLALVLTQRAAASGGLATWLGAGVAVGLAFLSKYNGAQLPAVVFVFLMLHPEGRQQLRRPGPWLALLVAVLIAVPNLVWVTDSQAAALGRPLEEGGDLSGPPARLAALAALPFLMLTPVLAVAWARQTWHSLRSRRHLADPGFRLAVASVLVPLALFVVVSMVTLVHAHWVATAFIGATPYTLENLEEVAARRGGPSQRLVRRGMVVAVLFFAFLVVLPFAGRAVGETEAGAELRPLRQVAVEMRGFATLRQRLQQELDAAPPGADVFLCSRGFHLTGLLEWLTDRRVPALPLRERLQAQYMHWHDPATFVGRDALFVVKRIRRSDERRLLAGFASYRRLRPIVIRVGQRDEIRYELYWCRGFRGLQ